MIEKILEPILAPFRMLREAIWKVKNAPMAVRSEIARGQAGINSVRSDFNNYKGDLELARLRAAQAKALAAGHRPGTAGYPNSYAQLSPADQQAPVAMPQQPQAQPAAAPAKPTKPGWFAKKKSCPQCNQKLHATWTECPFCGWGKGAQEAAPADQGMQAPMPTGGKQMTMAMNAADVFRGGVISSTEQVGWFIPLEGRQVGELFQIKGRTTIGKAADCNIVLAEDSISSHHAEFIPTPNGFRLNDLGSTNGTYVNDKRVATHDLIDNDNVKLGRINFKFKARE